MRTAIPRFAAALLFAAAGVGVVTSVGASTNGHPTLAQVEADISATLASTRVPDFTATLPTLALAPKTTEGRVPVACSSTSPTAPLPTSAFTSCLFGDRGIARTIFFFGDDDAAMWIPTFRALGTHRHWRVVIITHKGCSPWAFGTYTQGAPCHRLLNEEVALANRFHPAVIVPMGNKVLWRGSKLASVRYLQDQILRILRALAPSHAHVILFSPVPKFDRGYTGWTPQICLHTYRNHLHACETVLYNDATTSTAAQAIRNVALYKHLPLMATRNLFCGPATCALYVRTSSATLLIYRDAGHMNLIYANWISGALDTMIQPYLK